MPVETTSAGQASQRPGHPTLGRAVVEKLDSQLTSIQPGGGVCMQLELAWGGVRRALLKTFFPGYVRKMAELRKGSRNACPHEVLDPRDVKFYRNQADNYYWAPADDPFAWRDRLPFVRVGLAELFIFTLMFFAMAGAAAAWRWWAGIPLAVIGLLVAWFFRNPHRRVPTEAGLVVSPADGLLVAITEIEHDEFIGGPAVELGIFLSVFDVHINRTPIESQVMGLTYRRGKMLNALRPASAKENEQVAVRLEGTEAPYRRMIVRQITGAIARRIVCWVAPGEQLGRGEKFGMIKFGSRTELVLPKEAGLTIVGKKGQRVSAGSTVLARYSEPTAPGAN